MPHYREYVIDGLHRVQAEQVHPSQPAGFLEQFCPSLEFAGPEVNGLAYPTGDEPFDQPPRQTHDNLRFFSIRGRYGIRVYGDLWDWIVHDSDGYFFVETNATVATHYRGVMPDSSSTS